MFNLSVDRDKLNNFFCKIESEEKAYWLGFIAADGHISQYRVSIELSQKDEKHLQKFADLFNCKLQKRSRYDKRTGKNYHSCQLKLNSKKLSNSLLEKGLKNDKTFSLSASIFDCVPKELMHHFIRGYFDGDGSILISKSGKPKIVICGTAEFLSELRRQIQDGCEIASHNHYPKKNYCVYEVTGKENIIKVKDFLYMNSSVNLERKLEIFNKLKSKKKYQYVSRKGVYWMVDLYYKYGKRPLFKTEEAAVNYALSIGLDIYRKDNIGRYRNVSIV